MKIIVRRNVDQRKFLFFSLILMVILETLIGMGILADTNTVKMVQYVITFLPFGFCVYALYINRKNRIYWAFFEELKTGIILMSVLCILSLYKSFTAGLFSMRSMLELLQILLPFLYTFIMINELTSKEIMIFMKLALVITIFGYFYRMGLDVFTLKNIFNISLAQSYSPFEDSVFAEVSSGLAVFFIFFRKKAPFFCIISVLLNFLIFKRVLLLMTIVLLIISLTNLSKKQIPKELIRCSGILWIVIVAAYYYICQPEMANRLNNRFGINLVSFTMSRIYRLWYLIEHHFISYGLGSSSEYISQAHAVWLGSEMEMDFVRLFFELGIISIIVLILSYYKVCKNKLYAYVVVSLSFLNLLMANGLVRYWGWTYRLLTIAMMNYSVQSQEMDMISIQKNTQRDIRR